MTNLGRRKIPIAAEGRNTLTKARSALQKKRDQMIKRERMLNRAGALRANNVAPPARCAGMAGKTTVTAADVAAEVADKDLPSSARESPETGLGAGIDCCAAHWHDPPPDWSAAQHPPQQPLCPWQHPPPCRSEMATRACSDPQQPPDFVPQ